MKQIYRATDAVSGDLSYFLLNEEEGTYTVVSAIVCEGDIDAVEFLKSLERRDSLFFRDDATCPRRADMLGPVLLEEWE